MDSRTCSCIRSTYDLLVEDISPTIMIVHDLSDWVLDEEGFVLPDILPVMVMTPSGEVRELELVPGGAQVVRREDIGTMCDGIYTFTSVVCGTRYETSRLFGGNIQCSLDRTRIKFPEKDLSEIEMNLAIAKSSAKAGAIDEAEELLGIIEKQLRALSCDICKC